MLADESIKTELFLSWLGIFSMDSFFVINTLLCQIECLNESHVVRCFYLRQLVRHPFGSGRADFEVPVGGQGRCGQEVAEYPGLESGEKLGPDMGMWWKPWWCV